VLRVNASLISVSSLSENRREARAHELGWTLDHRSGSCLPTAGGRVATALRVRGSGVALRLRLWAAVCLALYVAFWLELDSPAWAGTTAAILCQPSLGASLRKGWFRMVGTPAGGVAIVVLTACFAQDRTVFLSALALWGAACAFASTLLAKLRGVCGRLSGYGRDHCQRSAWCTGGLNGEAFTLAISRVTEIASASSPPNVLPDHLGDARRQLATLLRTLPPESWPSSLEHSGSWVRPA